jgi:putative NADH-flavin reductase
MKLTVFGATGGIGGEVVRQALAAGHSVTAVVRDAARFTIDHPDLRVVQVADLTDVPALMPALEGSDAVISGVGPRSRKDLTVASSTGRAILAAMSRAGVRRFVAVTAAPVGPVPDDDSFFNRRILFPIIGRLFRGIYGDLADLEAQMMRSGTEWTIVRPPKLVNKPLSGKYRTVIGANVPRASLISRADVAHAMLAALGDSATVNQPVGVAN